MKKKLTALFLALVMCMAMSAPAFAADMGNGNGGIMPCEDDYRCHHTPPSGYSYLEYDEGNSICDFWIEQGVGYVAGTIPGIGLVATVVSAYTTYEDIKEMVEWVEEGNQLKTTYHRYTYVNEDGDRWHHYYWYSIGSDGYMHYLTCDVVEA